MSCFEKPFQLAFFKEKIAQDRKDSNTQDAAETKHKTFRIFLRSFMSVPRMPWE